MTAFLKNIAVACLLLLLAGCHATAPAYEDQWDLTPNRRDSLRFVREHHYGPNYNFMVTADSLTLHAHYPETLPDEEALQAGDSLTVKAGERLVVADFRFLLKEDSVEHVWIKVARDQQTMGWVEEEALLKGVVPDDPVSRFIHLFSNRGTTYFMWFFSLCFVVHAYRKFQHRGISFASKTRYDSFYPTALSLTISGAAALYAAIQRFAPEAWRAFYFHPSLNPFGQSGLLMIFLFAVWLLLLLALATIDDAHRQAEWSEAVPRLFSLGGFCIVLYIFFTLTCLYYVGFLFLPLYWAYALLRWNKSRNRYRCGRCGMPMRQKGICPHCHTLNR